jgi:ubiquinone/menaquinone biosynthesis C-methylase UbiE
MEPIKTKKTHRKGNSGKLTRLDINKERYKSEKKAGLPNSTKSLPRLGENKFVKKTNFSNNTTKVGKSFELKKLQTTNHKLPTETSTSWGGVASWYDKHLEGSDTYHTKVILPALMRIVGDIKGKDVLDLACGQGFFSRALLEKGAQVTGIDIGKELIASAESVQKGQMNKVHYFVTGADDLFMLKDKSMDIIVCVLALQNIENIAGTMSEVARVLRKGGKFIFVLNHPAFRNPQASSWGYHEAEKIQYRRIDSYLSESKVKIDMTPGNAKEKKFTVSFHRPLQLWSKLLHKNNLAIARMEEWESHKVSEKGPRQEAENRSRKEIPLFLAIESVLLY